jgi:hypothetical protein
VDDVGGGDYLFDGDAGGDRTFSEVEGGVGGWGDIRVEIEKIGTLVNKVRYEP